MFRHSNESGIAVALKRNYIPEIVLHSELGDKVFEEKAQVSHKNKSSVPKHLELRQQVLHLLYFIHVSAISVTTAPLSISEYNLL